MKKDLRELSMSHLVALRDLGRADLGRAQNTVDELTELLSNIKLEIEYRGKQQPE